MTVTSTKSVLAHRMTGPLGWLVVLAIVLGSYFCQPGVYPPASDGEYQTSLYSHRAGVQGDWKNPLVFDKTHNAEKVRLYPSLMSMELRAHWNTQLGYSNAKDRMLSGLFMLACAIMGAAFVWRKTRASGKALAAFACLALNPASLYAARTVGTEQEVIFLLALAVFLPLLAARDYNVWLSRIVWVASGFFACWAAVSHIFGLALALLFVLAVIAGRKSFHDCDGLGGVGRMVCFMLGGLLPMGITAYQYMHADVAGLLRDVWAIYKCDTAQSLVYTGTLITFAIVLKYAQQCLSQVVRAYALLCVIAGLALAVYVPLGAKAVPSFDQRWAALKNINRASGLDNIKIGTTYVDALSWPAADGTIKPYATIDDMRRGNFPKAIVARGDVLNATLAKGQNRILSGLMERKVLRGLVASQGDMQGDFYLMDVREGENILISVFDDKAHERRFYASYRDIVPMRKDLPARWYLVMSTPAVSTDLSWLGQEKGVILRYVHQGRGMVSLAVIEVPEGAELSRVEKTAMIFPMTEEHR